MGVRLLLRRALKRTSTSVFQLLPGVLGDGRLNRCLTVTRNGREVFRIRDFGPLTRMRAETFESKEPETLRWIESFEPGSRFLDVGANVGVFSLYAVARGCDVVAVEPDALNFALLHENIRLNPKLGTVSVRAYSLALHKDFRISELNVSSSEWGSALSSFDSAIDFKGDVFLPLLGRGCVGIQLDTFVEQIGFEPDHMKIDVDGNEIQVLQGAPQVLASRRLNSVLIELDERRPDYEECLRLLRHSGFKLVEKSRAAVVVASVFAESYNHVFRR